MVKLSKTGWNNVIIIVVMGFILLINATNKKIYSSDENAEANSGDNIALVGQQNVILTLSIDKVVAIERIGLTWRATPTSISGQALAQMMMSWQQSGGEAMAQAPEVDRQFSLDVELDIAGQTLPLQLNFYATDEQLLVFNQTSKQWLVMPLAMYGQLFPQAIFAS
tara:strand:- start:26819 stop:27316 length:498 start_codon:yes stop_codon:yes gene_type:complete